MFNRKLIIGIITLGVLGILPSSSIPVSAQTANNQPDSTITISPPSFVLKQAELSRTHTLVITNSGDTDIHVSISERKVERIEGRNVPSAESFNPKVFEISDLETVVPANGQKTLKIKILFDMLTIKEFPAIYIEETLTRSTSNAVSIGKGFYIPVLIEREDAEVSFFGNLNIPMINQFVINPHIDIDGSVKNTGNTFFNPAGSLVIFKDEVRVYEREITSQVAGLVFPNETKKFNLDFIHDDNPFKSIGQYTVEARINSTNSSNTAVIRTVYYYIPQESILILGISTISLLVFLIGLARIKRRTTDQ